MKIRIGLVAALATIAALTLTAPATATAASCSVTSAGGEKAPAIDNTAGTVGESGSQGYKCTVPWIALVQATYETGGVWVDCVIDAQGDQCPPGFHPNTPDQYEPANTGYNWPHISGGGHLSEPNWIWQVDNGVSAPDLPVCAYNWRIRVGFSSTNGVIFQQDTSPTLHKTC